MAEQLETRRFLSVYGFHTIAEFGTAGGANPEASLTLDSSGNIFGTTAYGGANSDGTVFEIVRGSASITTLISFNSTNGSNPYADLTLDSSGDLFGTTANGGASNDGSVFEIARGSAAVTTLVSFNSTNGSNPYAGISLDSRNDLFGTTYYGGASNDGTVFEIAHGSVSLTTLVSFNSTNGANPEAGLAIDSSGNVFGTTFDAGANGDGTLFEIPHDTGSLTNLVSFNGGNGAHPCGQLTLDSDDDLFGATSQGGSAGAGTVFEVAHGAASLTTLVSFNSADGSDPYAGVTLDASGNLFATTQNGGANGDGTVFEISHGGSALSTLASFNNANGQYPYAGLALDSQGDLFGATASGGVSGYGTIFELTADQAPPTVSLSAPNVTTAGGDSEIVTATFTASSQINASTIATANLSVSGPSGALSVMGVSLVPDADAATITASYTIAAPTSGWISADDGTYTVSLASGQVTDTAGIAVAAAQTTFTVSAPSAIPVATITAANVNSASAGSVEIQIAYTDAAARINTATIAASNVTVSGPVGSLAVSLASVTGSGNSVAATYLAAAPSGGWTTADSGTYTVNLLSGQVTDTSGNAAAGAQATFSVSIPAPSTPIGTAGKRPFVFDGGAAKISVTGGSVEVDQSGGQFDLTLTPTHVGGGMTVTIRVAKGNALTLADITAAAALRLTSFNAPAATLAGAMEIDGPVGALRLSSITGHVVANSIGVLSSNNVGGAITTKGLIGAVKLNTFTGTVAAGTIIRNFSAANVSGATLLAGAYLGSEAQIGASDDIIGPGSLAAITLGAISNTFIGAGVNPVDDVFGNGDDAAEPGADKIVQFKSKTALGDGVRIEAASFPKRVAFPKLTVPPTAAFVQLT